MPVPAPAASAPAADEIWYTCACHCGATLFKVHQEPLIDPALSPDSLANTTSSASQPPVNACNCSICDKNGYLLVYVFRSDIEFIRGWDELKDYRFATKTCDHKFCGVCGTSIGIDFLGKHRLGDILALNARIYQGVDIDKLNVYRGNGRQYQPEFNDTYAK